MKSARTLEKYVITFCRKLDKGEYAASAVIAEGRMKRAAGYARGVCKSTGETFNALCERLRISTAARKMMLTHSSLLAEDGSWTDTNEHDLLDHRLTAVESWNPEQLDLLRSINKRLGQVVELLAGPALPPNWKASLRFGSTNAPEPDGQDAVAESGVDPDDEDFAYGTTTAAQAVTDE